MHGIAGGVTGVAVGDITTRTAYVSRPAVRSPLVRTWDGLGSLDDTGARMESPHIIAITELRRHASDVIQGPVANGNPVFITQRGCVAAVILSREVFDRLARDERPHKARADSRSDESGPAALQDKSGVEAFGPLPRGTLFETPWNLVDAETAAFFMEEGIPVRRTVGNGSRPANSTLRPMRALLTSESA
jgi:prevent-host-death family protein